MRLTSGSFAPDVSAESTGGRRVSLAQLRGRPALLRFYRFATCPDCNLEAADIVTAWRAPQRPAARPRLELLLDLMAMGAAL